MIKQKSGNKPAGHRRGAVPPGQVAPCSLCQGRFAPKSPRSDVLVIGDGLRHDSPMEEVRFEPSVPRAKESVSLAEGNWMRESLHLVPLVIGSRGVICVSAVGVSC